MSDIQAFTVYRENASMFFGIDPLAPIVGSGSLRMHRNAVAAQRMNAVRTSGQRAFSSGRARFLVGCKTIINNDQIGCAFQQSVENLTTGTFAYYFLAVLTSTTPGSNKLLLTRETNSSQTILATGPTFTFQAGSKIAVEISWVLDNTNLGGGNPAIRLTVKRGTDLTGFSDLALETGMDIISTTNVLQTSAGEGPNLVLTTTTSNGDYLLEFPEVIPLVVGG